MVVPVNAGLFFATDQNHRPKTLCIFEDTTAFDIVSGSAGGTLTAPNTGRFQSN